MAANNSLWISTVDLILDFHLRLFSLRFLPELFSASSSSSMASSMSATSSFDKDTDIFCSAKASSKSGTDGSNIDLRFFGAAPGSFRHGSSDSGAAVKGTGLLSLTLGNFLFVSLSLGVVRSTDATIRFFVLLGVDGPGSSFNFAVPPMSFGGAGVWSSLKYWKRPCQTSCFWTSIHMFFSWKRICRCSLSGCLPVHSQPYSGPSRNARRDHARQFPSAGTSSMAKSASAHLRTNTSHRSNLGRGGNRNPLCFVAHCCIMLPKRNPRKDHSIRISEESKGYHKNRKCGIAIDCQMMPNISNKSIKDILRISKTFKYYQSLSI